MSAAGQSPGIPLAITTDLGEFTAGYSEHGLAEMHFPSDHRATTPASTSQIPAQIRQWHRVTSEALKSILAGETPNEMPPLDMSAGTEFQQSVWRALLKIQAGQTRSYGQIAGDIGKPKAGRAVGAACGANPIPVLVPCHRVLAANQKMGGFAGGLVWKRKLLAREGVSLSWTK
jgi:methylated-DNA-[protein]-cysteine S-methyltransferase